jgi:hypothetical protein
MVFLLHLPTETRNLNDSPRLSRDTCEFILQVVFQCTCPAVHRALIVKRDVGREDWNKTFGAATKRWQQLGKERGVKT